MSDKRKHKFMENLDKCYKIVQQSSAKGIGISATAIAEELGVHRTTIHGYLNTLELSGKVYSEKGLWFSREDKGRKIRAVQDYLIERYWREEEEIERAKLEGNVYEAYEKARLLMLKLPSPYKEKLFKAFKKVDEELSKMKTGDFFSTEQKQRSALKNTFIPYLVESISIVLHEMEEKAAE